MESESIGGCSFIDSYKMYAEYSTDAPLQYAEVMAIQLLGHAMGWEAIHLITPKAVHHNLYSIFTGVSTITRKSTSQELGRDIYPFERTIPCETSPEKMVEELSVQPESFQWLGEFTSLLKGVTSGGYMSRLVELYNDLHGCPKDYVRSLRKKKGEPYVFHIKNCYLSVNSTVTPEMLKKYLTDELMEGGFLARWLIVYGEPKPRKRSRLHPDALRLNEVCRNVIDAILRMEDKKVNFVFDDEALELYNKIEMEAYKKYDKILPFAGRYLNYLVSFSDIIMLSDAIGVAIEKGESIYTFRSLEQLIQLEQLDREIKEENRIKDINCSNCLIVSKSYVQKAWKIIQPCLDYVSTLVSYVELDKPTAVLMDYLRKVKEASHSKAMQYTHLNAKQMEIAVMTLAQRGDIQIINEEVSRVGSGPISKSTYRWIGD